ncbi:hypothetical protein PG996_013985 [Apiospora saccharicola]|uniref:2EXR domain-containing protein n=1 Tax=Apiospora saccharicola TaxID=335842 RepID=A0ABR1TIY3_9PEZI
MATSFHLFPCLPAELQLMIWDEAARADRSYVLIDAATHFRFDGKPRRAVMGITPTPNLRRPLFEVCFDARAAALKHCVRLDVWERPADMLEDHWQSSVANRALDGSLEALEPDRQMKSRELNGQAEHREEEAARRSHQGVTAATAPFNWRYQFPSGPQTKRGGFVYLNPESDVFVAADPLTKRKRDGLRITGGEQPNLLASCQRFIALQPNFLGGPETLFHAGPATKASTPAADLRCIPRHALQIRPSARYQRQKIGRTPKPERFDMKLQRSMDGLIGKSDARCADMAHVMLGEDLYALESCHRAYVDLAANEQAAILRDLCAGRDLHRVWRKRLLGGRLPAHVSVPYEQRFCELESQVGK